MTHPTRGLLSWLIVAVTLALPFAGLASAPPNDLFQARISQSGNAWTTQGSNVEATRESGEPEHNAAPVGKSVWWTWTASDDGIATISTAGSTFDTVLAVYAGVALRSLEVIAINDDGGPNFTSRVVLPVTRGATYQIAVDGYAFGSAVASGTIQLSLGHAEQQAAPTWRLRDVDGQWHASSNHLGRVVLLNFWATWCGPCVAEMPGLVNLHSRYASRGLAIIGVSVDQQGASVVRPFIPEHHLNYLILLTDGRIESDFGGIEFIPTTFLIDRDGNLVDKLVGYTDESDFERRILPLLGPADPPRLGIQVQGDRIVLFWSGDQSGAHVESAATAIGPWSAIGSSGVFTNDQFEASLSLGAQHSFFRLRR